MRNARYKTHKVFKVEQKGGKRKTKRVRDLEQEFRKKYPKAWRLLGG